MPVFDGGSFHTAAFDEWKRQIRRDRAAGATRKRPVMGFLFRLVNDFTVTFFVEGCKGSHMFGCIEVMEVGNRSFLREMVGLGLAMINDGYGFS